MEDCYVNWEYVIEGAGVAVLFLGFLGGIVTFNLQRKHDRELQKEQHKNKINLDIFNDITSQITETSSDLITVNGMISNLVGQIERYWSAREFLKIDYPDPPISSAALNDKFNENTKPTTNLVISIEKYMIVFPSFKLFTQVIIEQQKKVGSLFIGFYTRIIPFLPNLMSGGTGELLADKDGHVIMIKPDQVALDALKKEARVLAGEILTLDCFVEDMSVTLQQALLGGIFKDSHLNYRTPEDEEKYPVLKETPETREILQKFRDKLSKENKLPPDFSPLKDTSKSPAVHK